MAEGSRASADTGRLNPAMPSNLARTQHTGIPRKQSASDELQNSSAHRSSRRAMLPSCASPRGKLLDSQPTSERWHPLFSVSQTDAMSTAVHLKSCFGLSPTCIMRASSGARRTATKLTLTLITRS